MSLLPESIFFLIAASVAVVAAAFDGFTGTIPNRLTLPIVCAAPLAHGFSSGPGALGLSVLAVLACGAAPLLLFTRGGMGGGDVKLFAALGALVGSEAGLRIELTALFIALLYALACLAWRGTLLATLLRALRLLLAVCVPRRAARATLDEELTTTLRMGVPIAAATLVVLWLGEALPWLGL